MDAEDNKRLGVADSLLALTCFDDLFESYRKANIEPDLNISMGGDPSQMYDIIIDTAVYAAKRLSKYSPEGLNYLQERGVVGEDAIALSNGNTISTLETMQDDFLRKRSLALTQEKHQLVKRVLETFAPLAPLEVELDKLALMLDLLKARDL